MVILLADPSKAFEKLALAPLALTTITEELVVEMVAECREEADKEQILRLKGFNVVGWMEISSTILSTRAAS